MALETRTEDDEVESTNEDPKTVNEMRIDKHFEVPAGDDGWKTQSKIVVGMNRASRDRWWSSLHC